MILGSEWAINTTIMLLIGADGGHGQTNEGCAADKALPHYKGSAGEAFALKFYAEAFGLFALRIRAIKNCISHHSYQIEHR